MIVFIKLPINGQEVGIFASLVDRCLSTACFVTIIAFDTPIHHHQQVLACCQPLWPAGFSSASLVDSAVPGSGLLIDVASKSEFLRVRAWGKRNTCLNSGVFEVPHTAQRSSVSKMEVRERGCDSWGLRAGWMGPKSNSNGIHSLILLTNLF